MSSLSDRLLCRYRLGTDAAIRCLEAGLDVDALAALQMTRREVAALEEANYDPEKHRWEGEVET